MRIEIKLLADAIGAAIQLKKPLQHPIRRKALLERQGDSSGR
ncbi:hypothetical protein ACLIMP_05730 [Novosphingobium aerophilum]|nr:MULTISPECIES: hypothetical protein [unclassified Novosphingobium]WRT93737.1 hypothetical protein U9J33_04275 [Novosphingobium sp. RL4]